MIPWSPLGGGFLTGKYRAGQKPPPNARLSKLDRWHRLQNDRNFRILEAVAQVARQSGRSIPQVALAWVAQQPGVSSVICGARSVDQNEENLAALDLTLEPAEIETLELATRLAPEYPGSMQARLPGPRP